MGISYYDIDSTAAVYWTYDYMNLTHFEGSYRGGAWNLQLAVF